MPIDFREALAEALQSPGVMTPWTTRESGVAVSFEALTPGLQEWKRKDAAKIIAALPAAIREAVDLGMAWAEVEAEGAEIRGLSRGVVEWWAGALIVTDAGIDYPNAIGPTPTAALRALAAKLREVER